MDKKEFELKIVLQEKTFFQNMFLAMFAVYTLLRYLPTKDFDRSSISVMILVMIIVGIAGWIRTTIRIQRFEKSIELDSKN